MRPHFDLTLTMAAIVGVLTFGLRAAQVSPPTKPLRVAAVQSNVPQNQKFDPQFTTQNFRSIPAPERNCAAIESSTRFVDLAGKLHARAGA